MTVLDRSTAAPPSHVRSQLAPALLAVAVIGAQLALGLSFVVDQVGLPRIDAAEYVAQIATEREGYLAGTLLYGLGAALYLPAGMAISRVLGGGFGLLLGLLTGLVGVFAGLVTGMRMVLLGAIGASGPTAGTVAVFDAWQASPWFGVTVPMLVCLATSTLLYVGSILVTGWLPRWVAGATLVGTVLSSGELNTVVTASGGLLLVAGAIPLARAVLATQASVQPRR